MDKLNAYIYDISSSKNASIVFPASFEHIEDAYERLGKRENISAEFNIQFEDGHYLDDIVIDNVNLYELNHFANKIQSFNILEVFKLQGAVKKISNTDYGIASLINIAENILQNENIEAFPAENAYELGAFYVENNLIPEIEDIEGDAMTWIIEHSDYTAIGKEIEQSTGGVFSRDAFVIVGELEELYEGEFWLPEPCEYVFKLRVGFADEQDDGSRTTLVLPASHQAVGNLLTEYEVDYGRLACYKFESIIPSLESMDFGMTDIEALNQLAHSIQFFRENNELAIYKAMVDVLPTKNLENAIEVCEYVDEFTLQTATADLHDYVINNSNTAIPDELMEYLNVREYGNKLLEKDGANLTEYGALIPNDGVSLAQRLEQAEPTQSMEIGGIGG